MVTPFKNDYSLDIEALSLLTEKLITKKVDFLVVMGTTGEAATLTEDEKRQVLDTVIRVNQNRIPIIYGMGGNNTAKVCSELQSFNFDGVAGILSASPGYNKPTQEGIFQHYKKLNEVTPLPIMLYNVPGRTASNVEAETCIKIAHELQNIVAVKEASGDLNQITQIIENVPPSFQVFSGDDALTLEVIEKGGSGVISVIGNAHPEVFSYAVQKALESDLETASEIYNGIKEMIPLLFKEGNPAGVKALMHLQEMISPEVRLPLVKASKVLQGQIKKQMEINSKMSSSHFVGHLDT